MRPPHHFMQGILQGIVVLPPSPTSKHCEVSAIFDWLSWNQICIGVGLICFEIAQTRWIVWKRWIQTAQLSQSLVPRDLSSMFSWVSNLITPFANPFPHFFSNQVWKVSFSSQASPPAISPPIIRWGKTPQCTTNDLQRSQFVNFHQKCLGRNWSRKI